MSHSVRLETPRLLLRGFVVEDAAAVARLAGDRDIAATTRQIPHPYDAAMAEAWIASLPALHERGEVMNFAVCLLSAGELIGAVGLGLNGVDRHAELGYWIGKPYWNAGYATEAAHKVVEYAFKTLHLHRLFAHHFRRNPASGRVMEKLGMRREGLLREHRHKFGRFEDLVVYGMTRADYESSVDNSSRRA